MRSFPRYLTYANVVASLALFVALGGAGYAASQLPKNSVGSAQIKSGAVANAKLAANAVTGPKVKTGSLDGTDLGNGSIGAAQINVTGLPTVPSAAAATVAGGLAKVTFKTATATVPPGQTAGATATCDAGQVVVGGGGDVESDLDEILNDSHPQGSTAWNAVAYNASGASGPHLLTVHAICVPATAG